ncbi:MAG: hypothetical protein IPK26_10175 [Planctomycetes bacterium]|nr:hypothetical protein [Planctomycetota bacterium]
MSRSKWTLPGILGSALLAHSGAAQIPGSGWVVSYPNGLDVLDRNGASWAFALTGRLVSIVVDERGELFRYNYGEGVYAVLYQPPQLNYGPLLFGGVLYGSVHADRSHLLVVDDSAQTVSFVSKTPPHSATTVAGQFSAGRAAYDGRNLYWVVPVHASNTFHVFGVDTRRRPLAPRPIASLPVRFSARSRLGLTIGPDGRLLLLDDNLLLIDPETGAMTALSPPPPDPLFYRVYSWGTDTKPTVLAYDPWTDTIMVGLIATMGGLSALWEQTYGSGVWSLWFPIPLVGLNELQSTSARPFEPFGLGCDNATGRDAKLGWAGLPAPGRTFSITLRDAEPNSAGVIWLGLSETRWHVPLPLDLGPMGAPGCSVLVSGDDPWIVTLDGVGKAAHAFQVPAAPALAGLDLFSQAAHASTVNALGLTVSDAMMIRVR